MTNSQIQRGDRIPTTTKPRSPLDAARNAYYRSDDLFVGVVAVDSKSRATIIHPMRGLITVDCAELTEV